jgi:predicted enzyme related to lactoylglutathione lyase
MLHWNKQGTYMPNDGALDYIELPGPDIPATKQFYGSLFGWKFTDYGPDYVAFEKDGREGGFNAERKVVKDGGPLVVLYANDLDGMEARVRAAGAEIVSRESFEGGRRFHFRDPNGNEIAVWTKA